MNTTTHQPKEEQRQKHKGMLGHHTDETKRKISLFLIGNKRIDFTKIGL